MPMIIGVYVALPFLANGLNAIAQYYLYSHNFFKTNGLYSYNSAAVFLSGLIVFELFRQFLEGKKISWKKAGRLLFHIKQ